MTAMCGWLPKRADADAASKKVIEAMGRVLRVHDGQDWASWTVAGGLSVGLLEVPAARSVQHSLAPAVSSEGRHFLWMLGEAYSADSSLGLRDVNHSHELSFRQQLLKALLARPDEVVRTLDGQYHILLWDSVARQLTLYNDRFGGLTCFWARPAEGIAFASGVRGVLMAPGISVAPDEQALREAVTFGGFRLGDRTNIAAVKKLPPATVLTGSPAEVNLRKYWNWHEIKSRPNVSLPDAVREIDRLWRQSVARRLCGARRQGQALSGGLDSRAILAEAAPQAPSWTAVTYGVTGCDDAVYARKAAEARNVTWVFSPMYAGGGDAPDWLERRASYIQQTDGLVQLIDLMHFESLPLQTSLFDVSISGYGGDFVTGASYSDVDSLEGLVAKQPYYGAKVGLPPDEARECLAAHLASTEGSSFHLSILEHKYPQAINLIFEAFRPWQRVRKPFVDYEFFEFCQGLPRSLRLEAKVREHWLVHAYPDLFKSIPNQATGVPVLTSHWRWQTVRAQRFGWRKVQPWLRKVGIEGPTRIRNYIGDGSIWEVEAVRRRISDTILDNGSLCCEILGRDAVTQVVEDFFGSAGAPAQVIGAMYVYERYHRDLKSTLRSSAPTG